MTSLGLRGDKAKLFSFFVMCALAFAMLTVIPQTLGLSKGGFSITEILQQFFFYVGPGIGFLLGIIALTIATTILKKGDAKYGDGLGFDSAGELPHWRLPFFKNKFQLLLACIIIFSILG